MSYRNYNSKSWNNDKRNDRGSNSSFRKNNRNYYNNYKWNQQHSNFSQTSHRNNSDYNNWSRSFPGGDYRRNDNAGLETSGNDINRY